MTWTLASSSLDNGGGNGVCWATDLSRFVSVGLSSGATAPIIWSDNGVAWTAGTGLTAADQFFAVVRSVILGLHLTLGQKASTSKPLIYRSSDGKAWSSSTIPTAWDVVGFGTAVACKQSSGLVMLAAVGVTTAIITTTNGTTFTAHASPFDGGAVVGIAYSPSANRWIAGGIDSGGTPLVAYSDDDGSSWTTITAPFSSISFGPKVYRDETNSKWWLLGPTTGGKSVATSSNNGATWAEIATPLDGTFGVANGMVNAGSALLLVGIDDSGTKQSCVSWDAGSTWALDDTPSPFGTSIANGVAYSPTIPIAVTVGNSP